MGIPPASLSVCPKTTQIEREARREVTIADLLVWAYRDQLVGEERGGAFLGGIGSNTSAVATILAMGARIDGEGAPWVGEVDAHPDARAVQRLVQGLEPAHLVRLVESRASLGHPPIELGDAPPRLLRPSLVLEDGQDHAYAPAYGCGKEPVACLLAAVPSLESVTAGRQRYEAWRQAVVLLQRQLHARPWLLTHWRVSAALPPELPPLPRWWTESPLVLADPLTRDGAVRLWELQERRRATRARRTPLDSRRQKG